MKKARVFWLHFNRLGQKRGDPDVWTVHMSARCLHARTVEVDVPVTTVYKGDTAHQPRAFLRGVGIVHTKRNGRIKITSK